MPSRSAVLGKRTVRGEQPLRMAGRWEPLHAIRALTHWPMRVLTAVIEVAAVPVFHPRQYFALGRVIALQFICDDDPWDVLTSFEQLAEKLLRGVLVPPTLYEDIEDMVVLIHRAPEVVPFAIHCQNFSFR